MNYELETTLDADEILGMFGDTKATSAKRQSLRSASSPNKSRKRPVTTPPDRTINATDEFISMFNASPSYVSQPMPLSSRSEKSRHHRHTLLPNDLTFLQQKSSSTQAALDETINEDDSFLFPTKNEVAKDEFDNDDDDDDDDDDDNIDYSFQRLRKPSFVYPPATPSESLTSNKVQSILRTSTRRPARAVSVGFVRTKSVLRFDNKLPVNQLKEEKKEDAVTPGKLKQIREEELHDNEEFFSANEVVVSKRLDFGEEESFQAEEEVSFNEMNGMESLDESFVDYSNRRATLAAPNLMDFAENVEEEFQPLRGLPVPPSPHVFVPDFVSEFDSFEMANKGRRETLGMPTILDFSEPSISLENAHSRRETLAAPSLMDFATEDEYTTVYEKKNVNDRRETLAEPSILDFAEPSLVQDPPLLLRNRRDTLAGPVQPAVLSGKASKMRESLDSEPSLMMNKSKPQDSSLGKIKSLLSNSTLAPMNASSSPVAEDHDASNEDEEELDQDDSLVAATRASLPNRLKPSVDPLDELLLAFFPDYTNELPVPVPEVSLMPNLNFGTFQSDVKIDAQGLSNALIYVHKMDNSLNFVENQLYQVAMQRKALLPEVLPLPTNQKLKKTLRASELEAEHELNQWMIQVQTDYLRSLENQVNRVKDDISVIQVEQVKHQQNFRELRSEIAKREKELATSTRLEQLQQRFAESEAKRIRLLDGFKNSTEELTQCKAAVRELQLQTNGVHQGSLKEMHAKVEFERVKLNLQENLCAGWKLKTATSHTAEIEFPLGFSLVVNVDEEKQGIRVRVNGNADDYVTGLVKGYASARLFDVVHLLTLIEDHVLQS